MPRIQIFVNPDIYPDTIINDEKGRVAQFLKGFPAVVADTFGVPEDRVRLFVTSRSDFDQSPVDIDITTSIKFPPEDGLLGRNGILLSYATEQLGRKITVGSHLLQFSEDAWATSLG